MSNYDEYFKEASKKYGVDEKLLRAVAQQESGINQDVKSSKGAVGVMQLMPQTAKALGVNPNNAKENIMGGAKYISQLSTLFGGDIDKVLASYNCGSTRVVMGKWKDIPETVNYVNKVKKNYQNMGGSPTAKVGGYNNIIGQDGQFYERPTLDDVNNGKLKNMSFKEVADNVGDGIVNGLSSGVISLIKILVVVFIAVLGVTLLLKTLGIGGTQIVSNFSGNGNNRKS